MASRLNPYINFDGNAREALEFYRDALGGELTTNTYGEYGTEGDFGNRIMHGSLEAADGLTLMAADLPPGQSPTPGGNLSICLNGDDGDTLRDYWGKLSAGGEVHVPLEKQMWGDEFGQCVDKFGVTWLVNIGAPQG